MKIKSFCSILKIVIVIISLKLGYTKSIRRNVSRITAEYEKEIILEERTLLSQQLNMKQNVKIVCPFEQPLWYYNETLIHMNKTLAIDNIFPENGGLYSCTSRRKETMDNVWANVTIFVCAVCSETESNKFYKDIVKYFGESVDLNCDTSVQPTVNISWTLNNSVINMQKSKAMLKKGTLSITNLNYSDSGLYTCHICKTSNCFYRSTNLTVVNPEISNVIAGAVLKNQSVNLGDNAIFECGVGYDPELHISWFKHEIALNSLTEANNILKNPNIKRMVTQVTEPQILRLGSVQKEDEGWYTCVATNSIGETVASAYLTVSVPNANLQILKVDDRNSISSEASPMLNTLNLEQQDNDESSDHEIEHENIVTYDTEEGKPEFKNLKKLINYLHKPSGSSVQLLCPARGNPSPNITWTRNDTEIERHIGKVTYKKWSIQMDDSITKDSGVYKCKICNIHGCIEHSTKLTIFDRLRSRPIISDKYPQNQTVLTYSNASLECRVISDLEPFIFWLKYSRKNQSIEELEKIAQHFDIRQSTNKTDDIFVLETDLDKPNILTFPNVTHEDEGWYSCVSANSLGQTVASAYLKVVDKHPLRDGLQRSHPAWITTVGVVVVMLFLLGTVFIIYVLRNLKHEKLLKQRIETVHQWTKKVIIYKPPASEGSSCDLQMPVIKIEKQRTTFTTSTNSDPTQGFNEYEFPLDSNWEIPRNQLTLGSTLGEGAFGRVVMAQGSGFSRVSSNIGATTIVAVKMVKEEHTDADMASLVREMEVMKMIGKHINIINLLGCCSQNGPLWVIVEFAPHGNLKDFLKKNRPQSAWGSCSLKRNSEYLEEAPVLTEKHLTSFAFQIARGMEYLASRRVCIL